MRIITWGCVCGCDSWSHPQEATPRKTPPDNLSLAGDGFDTVNKAKPAVEAARDVVLVSGGPWFNVELGRISSKFRVPGNLPPQGFNLNLLSWIFRKNNLTRTDMIPLSATRTVGFLQCNKFLTRPVLPCRGGPVAEPGLLARQLMQACPRNVDPGIAISMDPSTPNTFDNAYFKNLVNGKGLLSTDQVLFTNLLSRTVVNRFANNPWSFTQAFAMAMVKLGRTGVKTGSQGGIRRDCSVFS